MKTVSGTLATLLATSNEFVMADLYTFTLVDGTIQRYADFDIDLTYSAVTWNAGGPVIERDRTRTVVGLEVDTLSVRVSPKDTDMIGSQTWLQAACSGRLDGAIVSLDRAFMSPGLPLSVAGTVSMFVGNVAQLTIDRGTIDITVNSPMELLNIQMPRNVYQAGCRHALFDSGCGLAKASFAVSSSISGGASSTGFSTGLAQSAGFFNLGVVQLTSGAMSGVRRTVKSYAGGAIVLLNPLPMVPAAGTSFTIWPGCDKKKATCSSKFSNLANFGGLPYIPVPETAI